jgi:glutamate--cysteine ligase catalytic subunit
LKSSKNEELKVEDKIEELYIFEILEGKPEINFKGIYPLVEEYMSLYKYDKESVAKVRDYLSFLLERSKGKIKTGAKFIREFVMSHP